MKHRSFRYNRKLQVKVFFDLIIFLTAFFCLFALLFLGRDRPLSKKCTTAFVYKAKGKNYMDKELVGRKGKFMYVAWHNIASVWNSVRSVSLLFPKI